MTDAPIRYAGGLWPVIDSRDVADGTGQTVWAYAEDCSEVARAVLAQEGVTSDLFKTPEGQAQIYVAHGIESRAGMALGLWLSVHRARAILSSASRSGGAPLAEAVAGAFIHLTQLRCVLDNLHPGGVASAAVTGAQAQSQRLAAAAKGGNARTRHDWRDAARRIWAAEPTASQTSVATRVAAEFVADQSSVMRSIKPLIPLTSSTFKGE